MFAKLIAVLMTSLAGNGSKLAAAVTPYAIKSTPALVALGCGVAFYLTHKTDTTGLVLAALAVVNEAVVAAQLQATAAPSPPKS